MSEPCGCRVCGSNVNLRLGVCWDCATIESIIDEGLDMFDKGPDGKTSTPARTPMEKLRFMRQLVPNYFNTPRKPKS